MAANIYKINYKSDFVLTIQSDAGWAIPFCVKFWTGMPSESYFVGFDGTEHRNCRMGDTPDKLVVLFDDHHLPIGELKMQIAYHTTIEEFPTVEYDEVTNAQTVTTILDGEEYHVTLDFTGETAPEIQFALPAYYNEQERQRVFAEMQAENAQAVQEAENVNATLSGTVLTVTNRNGISTSVDTKGDKGDPGTTDYNELSNKPNLATVATSGSYNDLQNKPTIPTVPTNVSAFTNDAGYVNDISGKQDVLVSGENIKTVNGNSILGSGNIEIQGGGSADAVLYTEQSLTSEQKAQARTNIGAGTSSFSGSYNDLSDKPTIPAVPTNVSSFTNDAGYLTTETDPTVPSWAKASSKPSYDYSEIWNTPSLATVATSGNYNDLTDKPTIPEQEQADWNETDNSKASYIRNRPPIIGAEMTYEAETESIVITPASAVTYDSETETLEIL